MRVIAETSKPCKDWFTGEDSTITRQLILEKLAEKCLLILPNNNDSTWLLEGTSNASTLRPIIEEVLKRTPLSNRIGSRAPDLNFFGRSSSVEFRLSDTLVSKEFQDILDDRTDFPVKGSDRDSTFNKTFGPMISFSSEIRVADTYLAWNLQNEFSGATWLLSAFLGLGATDIKIFTAYTNTTPGKPGSKFAPVIEQKTRLVDHLSRVLSASGIESGKVTIYLNGRSNKESHPRYIAFHFKPSGVLYAHLDKGAEVFAHKSFRSTPQVGPWDTKKGRAYSLEVEGQFTEALICTKSHGQGWRFKWISE